MESYSKPIVERFRNLLNSKTAEELKLNEELFQLQMELDHQKMLTKIAEDSIEFYRRLDKMDRRLDAVITEQESKQ